MIDSNKTYKVTKIKVNKENSDRYVKSGDSVVGTVVRAEVGSGMLVHGTERMWDGLYTSNVEKIEAVPDTENFLVQTVNSTYSVELIQE